MNEVKTENTDISQSGVSGKDSSVHDQAESGDVAAKFLSTLDPAVREAEVSPEEARKVLWKIDLIILPIIAGTVILSAVDKVSGEETFSI